ncbi:MAG: phosphoribosyltransferase [Rhodospirillaceae bacterium]|nr:phosphoribosyltransferase [Rhodospirillaceae bacterium]
MFDDRADAGRQLAGRLEGCAGSAPIVLALPRGGVAVAREIADALGAPLDLLMVRKIGLPWQPELALGAIVDGAEPQTVINEDVAAMVRLPADYIEEESRRQLAEIERRRKAWLGDRAPLDVAGRTVIVVDDGIATGATTRAALRGLRRRKPAHLVLAVPVAPPDTVAKLQAEVDDLICLETPRDFGAIGFFYRDFHQMTDDEVMALLG